MPQELPCSQIGEILTRKAGLTIEDFELLDRHFSTQCPNRNEEIDGCFQLLAPLLARQILESGQIDEIVKNLEADPERAAEAQALRRWQRLLMPAGRAG